MRGWTGGPVHIRPAAYLARLVTDGNLSVEVLSSKGGVVMSSVLSFDTFLKGVRWFGFSFNVLIVGMFFWRGWFA